jgi:hypothetical protein
MNPDLFPVKNCQVINEMKSTLVSKIHYLTIQLLKDYLDGCTVLLQVIEQTDLPYPSHVVATILTMDSDEVYALTQMVSGPTRNIWTICRCSKDEIQTFSAHFISNHLFSGQKRDGTPLGWISQLNALCGQL